MTPVDELRDVVRAVGEPPAAAEAYLQKVRLNAYTVTDSDVAALADAGLTEDEVFEHTVAAAISEGLRRLDAAERVI